MPTKASKPVTLPDEPSALIRLALRDLEKAERSRLYTIDMDNWHLPNGVCKVCFAGSVMAFSLGARRHDRVEPEDFDNDTRRKLIALNYFRSGRIEYGLLTMGRSLPPGVPDWDRSIRPYADDPSTFKSSMRSMAKMLAKAGL